MLHVQGSWTCSQGLSDEGGSSQFASTSTVEAAESVTKPEDLTESQLELLLASRRLNREKSRAPSNSQTNTVIASENQAETVGTWICVLKESHSQPWWTRVLSQPLSLVQHYTQ